MLLEILFICILRHTVYCIYVEWSLYITGRVVHKMTTPSTVWCDEITQFGIENSRTCHTAMAVAGSVKPKAHISFCGSMWHSPRNTLMDGQQSYHTAWFHQRNDRRTQRIDASLGGLWPAENSDFPVPTYNLTYRSHREILLYQKVQKSLKIRRIPLHAIQREWRHPDVSPHTCDVMARMSYTIFPLFVQHFRCSQPTFSFQHFKHHSNLKEGADPLNPVSCVTVADQVSSQAYHWSFHFIACRKWSHIHLHLHQALATKLLGLCKCVFHFCISNCRPKAERRITVVITPYSVL